jgi:hypothetical protein
MNCVALPVKLQVIYICRNCRALYLCCGVPTCAASDMYVGTVELLPVLQATYVETMDFLPVLQVMYVGIVELLPALHVTCRVGQSIMDCFLQTRRRHHWGTLSGKMNKIHQEDAKRGYKCSSGDGRTHCSHGDGLPPDHHSELCADRTKLRFPRTSAIAKPWFSI